MKYYKTTIMKALIECGASDDVIHCFSQKVEKRKLPCLSWMQLNFILLNCTCEDQQKLVAKMFICLKSRQIKGL